MERAGIPTVQQQYYRDVALKLRPPRALWVPFALGHALGAPDDSELQLSVLRQTFALLDEPGPPPALKDYVPLGARVGGLDA